MNRRTLLALLPLIPALKAIWPKKKPWSTPLLSGPIQGETFDLKMIDDLVEKAKAVTPVIKPVIIDGKSYYVFYPQTNSALHEYLYGDWHTLSDEALDAIENLFDTGTIRKI